MRRFAFAIIAASLIAVPAAAKPCRNSHGKFVKCSPLKMMPKKTCRDAKGHFKKCWMLRQTRQNKPVRFSILQGTPKWKF